MRVYSDNLVRSEFYRIPISDSLGREVSEPRNSRKRRFCYDLHMFGDQGTDRHGIPRLYHTNSGGYGAGYEMAATWVEWGDYIVSLFKLDPSAIVGPYASARKFVYETLEAAEHRPARESAPDHAARWRDELIRAGVISSGCGLL